MAFSILRLGVRPTFSVVERAAVVLPIAKSSNLDLTRNFDLACQCPSRSKSVFQTPTSFLAIRNYSKNVSKPTRQPDKKYKSSSDSDFDSDSDNEHKVGHRGESDFWRRKMRTFHGILDVNKDGVIAFDDFKLLADRFVSLGHMSEKQKKEFQKVITDLWEKLWGEITPYNLVTVERYLDNMHHVLNDKALKKKAHSFLPYLFKAVDKDKSGEISVEEFKLFFQCLGLNDLDATFAFRTVDTNGDGKISIKEFVKHGREFFLTENEDCISKFFWGPLVEH